MNTRQATPRLAALCAAIVMSALAFASQLGLAEHYAAEAGAVLAAQRAASLAIAADAARAAGAAGTASATAAHQPNS